jgi:hypothetical protein
MSANILQTTTPPAPQRFQTIKPGLPGMLRIGRDAWHDYRYATNPADRLRQMWLLFLYLSAVVLPLGSLLILARWMYLRHHL